MSDTDRPAKILRQSRRVSWYVGKEVAHVRYMFHSGHMLTTKARASELGLLGFKVLERVQLVVLELEFAPFGPA